MEKTKLIPICSDIIFKKMFGDPDSLDRTAVLLSIILNVPYEKLKGKLEVIESEKRVTNYYEKKNKLDILTRVKINAFNRVDLEMNLDYDITDIIRNTGFITHVYSSYLKSGEKYKKMGKVIQINFNNYDIDKENTDIVDKYYLMNNNRHILTDNLQIYEINIATCYKIWYNKLVDNYNFLDGQIIILCALMMMTDKDEFRECLGEIDMDELVKQDIEKTEHNLSEADEIFEYYGSEEEIEKWQRSKISNAFDDGVEKGIEQGIEQGSKQEKINIAKNMLSENIEINIISKVTGLSIDELEEMS